MPILPAQKIDQEISAGRLILNASALNIEACSYDLRIGTVFKDGQAISSSASGLQSFVLRPGEMLSMFTLEDISLPDNICATVFPINSQSSKGLLVLNPGHIDPGYKGPISVRVLNISKQDMLIKHEEPIFTIVFDELLSATTKPYINSNSSRAKLEKDFAEKDINLSPGSLKKIVGEPNVLEIEKIVRTHWMSWSVFILTLLAAIFALIAAFPVFKDARTSVGDEKPKGELGQANEKQNHASVLPPSMIPEGKQGNGKASGAVGNNNRRDKHE